MVLCRNLIPMILSSLCWYLFGVWRTAGTTFFYSEDILTILSYWNFNTVFFLKTSVYGVFGIGFSCLVDRYDKQVLMLSSLLLIPWLSFNFIIGKWFKLLFVILDQFPWILPAYVIIASLGSIDFTRIRRCKLPNHYYQLRGMTAGFIFCAALFSVISVVPHLALTGDEPHYIKITQSIIQDFDTDLRNQEPGYSPYWPNNWCRLHHFNRTQDGRLISIHSPGLPFLVSLFYMLGGRWGICIFLSTCLVLTAVISVTIVQRLDQSKKDQNAPIHGYNVQLLAIVCFSSCPLIFFSFQIYPELIAGLCITLTIFAMTSQKKGIGAVLAGMLAVAFLPWLHVKYSLLALIGFLSIILCNVQKFSLKKSAIGLIPVASVIFLMMYYDSISGSVLPFKAYSEFVQSTGIIENSLKFGFGFSLLDMRHSIFLYGPIYLTAFLGIRPLFSKNRKLTVILLILVSAHLLVTLSHISNRWLGWAPPLRFFVPILPVAFIFVTQAYTDAKRHFIQKGLLILLGVWQCLAGLRLIQFPAYIHQREHLMDLVKAPDFFLESIFPLISDSAQPLRVFSVSILYLAIFYLVLLVSVKTGKEYETLAEPRFSNFLRLSFVLALILIGLSAVQNLPEKNVVLIENSSGGARDILQCLNDISYPEVADYILETQQMRVKPDFRLKQWLSLPNIDSAVPDRKNENVRYSESTIRTSSAEGKILQAIEMVEHNLKLQKDGRDDLEQLLDLHRARRSWEQISSTAEKLIQLNGSGVYTMDELIQVKLASYQSLSLAYQSLLSIHNIPAAQKNDYKSQVQKWQDLAKGYSSVRVAFKRLPELDPWGIWPE